MDIALFVIAVLTLICAAVVVPFVVLAWKQGHRQEQRHTERSDVSWRVDQDEIPGRLRVVNIGRDPAYDVHVVISVDEETLRSEADVVSADEALVLDSQTLREAMEEKFRDQARAERESRQSGPFSIRIPTAQLPDWVTVDTRVSWRSPGQVSGNWSESQRYAI